jgi:hypothetical protein
VATPGIAGPWWVRHKSKKLAGAGDPLGSAAPKTPRKNAGGGGGGGEGRGGSPPDRGVWGAGAPKIKRGVAPKDHLLLPILWTLHQIKFILCGPRCANVAPTSLPAT